MSKKSKQNNKKPLDLFNLSNFEEAISFTIKNDKLLTIFGVFGAIIVVFFTNPDLNLNLVAYGSFIIFLFLTVALFLGFIKEFYKSFNFYIFIIIIGLSLTIGGLFDFI
ncbi:hypothetical protein JXB41_00005, partial [Candidatus Woesearchaeota archaeon]|nr:hypothetical protein [Candidatus Woesearchaeota archaeon]